ncbi:MAG: hypothetical protein KQ78_00462 [Candidatus Izimaplasma bacterium HR2]|nr:MAG: hypothetical protein KQ78_00462 [Candidatus Izimaplasma bacterium HR2]
MRLQQYLLTEKTFNIGVDVDLVFNTLVKSSLTLFKKKKYKEFEKALTDDKIINSSILKTKQAKKAHELNPVTIVFSIDGMGNYYKPSIGIIHFSYNEQVLKIFKQNNYEPDRIKNVVGKSSFERFSNEMSDSALKGTIYHELSHWLNDTFHNKNISKMLSRSQYVSAAEAEKITKQGHEDVGMTWYEIDAQIHALKQMKRDMKSNYNYLGWDDIMKLKPSFVTVFQKAALSNEYDNYMKNLTKRMHRENLLTKKLSKYPNDNEMYTMTRNV